MVVHSDVEWTGIARVTFEAFSLNRIYNKILDRGWLSAGTFVSYSARDHVGVQLQVSDLNFLYLATCDWIPT